MVKWETAWELLVLLGSDFIDVRRPHEKSPNEKSPNKKSTNVGKSLNCRPVNSGALGSKAKIMSLKRISAFP